MTEALHSIALPAKVKRGLRIKQLIQVLLFITLIATASFFFFSSGGSMFNAESLLYLTILTVIMAFVVNIANRMSFPLILVLIIYTYQRYILSGLVMLSLTDGSNASTSFGNYLDFTAENYNVCLRYAILGFSAIASGIILGVSDAPANFNMKSVLKDRMTKRLSGSLMLVYFLTISAFTLYAYYFKDERYVGIRPDDEGSWLRLFLNSNIAIGMAISIVFFRSEAITKKSKYFLYTLLVISLLLSIQAGSRSYIYLIFVNYILIFMAIKNGNFKVRVNIKILASIIFLSIILYPIATIIRYKDILEETGVDASEVFNQSSIDYLYGEDKSPVVSIVMSAFQRINSFETSLMIMNDKNIMPYDDLLSFPYVIGRIINNFFPGDPIPNLILPQYLFDHIYYNKFVGWNAYDWGLWEEFYLIFGYWTGIVVLFFFMVLIGFLWRWLLLSNFQYKLFYISTFIYFFLQRLLINYEVSLVISSVLLQLLIFHIIYFVLVRINSTLRLKPMETS